MRDRAEASIERAEAMDGRSERPGDGDRQPRACVTHDVGNPRSVLIATARSGVARPGRVFSRQVGAEAHSQQGTSRYTVFGTHFVTV